MNDSLPSMVKIFTQWITESDSDGYPYCITTLLQWVRRRTLPFTKHLFISATCHDKRLSRTIDGPFTHYNQKSLEKWVIEPIYDKNGRFTICSLERGKYDGRLIVKWTSSALGNNLLSIWRFLHPIRRTWMQIVI